MYVEFFEKYKGQLLQLFCFVIMNKMNVNKTVFKFQMNSIDKLIRHRYIAYLAVVCFIQEFLLCRYCSCKYGIQLVKRDFVQ